MASSLNKKHRKKCKALSVPGLKKLINELEPRVKEESSLLEVAKWEYRRRLTMQARLQKESENKEE